MNPRNIKMFFSGLLSVLLISSCTKDFEELNTDPDNIQEISPNTLLNPVLYELATFNVERNEGFTMDLMQVRLPWPSASLGVHRYVVGETAGNSTWNAYYRWLNNLNEMEKAAINVENHTYQAIALTLKAWTFSLLTDCFGDIPMVEALQAEQGQLKPVFDKQQTVYTTLLQYLEQANTLFKDNHTMPYGTEMLYSNNAGNWRRFANSLHLRLLLRVSNRPEMNAAEKMKQIVDNPTEYPVFTSNAQSAIYKITGETPNVSPWSRYQDFITFRCAAEFFVSTLNDFNDPRRAKWLTKATDLSGADIGYKGIPSGYSGDESQFPYNPSNYVKELAMVPNMVIPLMTYSEVAFIKAELAQKGIITGDAKAFYEAAVKASIEQWGATVPADYFTNPLAAYDGTLDRIMLQKYVSFFFTDYQQWFEYRRTGLPVLPVADGMVNDKKVPVRFRYPDIVQITNNENYKAAVQSMGGDDINTKVWWEK